MPFYPNDMLTSAFLVGAVNDKPSKEAIRQSYRGLELLPWEEVPERQVVWDIMYSENNLAGFYGPKGEAVPGDDVMFSTTMATLSDIKASRTLETWAAQQLRDPGELAVYRTGTQAGRSREQKLKEHINKRLAWCNEAVDAQIEYIAMQALQGTVVWPPVDSDGNAIANPMPHWNADLSLSISVGLPAAQNQNVTTLSGYNSRTGAGLAWTNASATPFNDLDIINEYMIKTFGVNLRGGTVLIDSVTLGYMSRNTSILNWVAGSNYEQPGARQFADIETIKSAIKAQFGWTLVPYDAQWTYRSPVGANRDTIQRVDFLKEGKIVVLPPGGPVGTMMTAPQMTKDRKFVYRKMGWEYQNPKPPYDIELGVNAVCWPRFNEFSWFVLNTRA